MDQLNFADWSEEDRNRLSKKLGDVLLLLIQLAHLCGTDLPKAAVDKMEKNRKKYPADKFYGSSEKYDQKLSVNEERK